MSALSIQPTFPIFTETDGHPLENGYIWIGTANLDPQVNPINVYWDAALTISAPQPIRTINGYPSRNGTPGRLYVNSDYSIRVMNRNGSTVYSAPAATERYNNVVVDITLDASKVLYTAPGVGAVQRTGQDKFEEIVNVDDYGAVGDWNGTTGTDNTAFIQAAIDANPGKRLIFTSGKRYLLNSYNGRAFNSILSVDTSMVFDMYGSELVVGPYFDDKEFIAINCKGSFPSPAPVFDDLQFLGGIMSFSGAVNQMGSGFLLYRVGIHTGQAGNIRIDGMTFRDGDIANAIKVNDDVFAKKNFVLISNCVFTGLVQENPVNTDHSSVYLKAENSHVINCVFKGTTTQNRRVACAVELHGDNSSWIGGSVEDYNKGVFLTALLQEGSTEHLIVSDVVSETTNAFAYIWSENGVFLRDVLISDCNIRCRHIAGEGGPYNQFQGLLTTTAFSLDAISGDGITCRGNRVEIISTTVTGRDTAVYMHLNHAGVVIDDNDFYNCNEGIKTPIVSGSDVITRWTITNNRFLGMGTISGAYVSLETAFADTLTFTGNQIQVNTWNGTSRFLKIAGGASTCTISVKSHDFLAATPAAGVEMATVANNKVENVLYGASFAFPGIGANAFGVVGVSHPILTSMYAGSFYYDIEAMNVVTMTNVNVLRAGTATGASPILLAYNNSGTPSLSSTETGKLFVRTF